MKRCENGKGKNACCHLVVTFCRGQKKKNPETYIQYVHRSKDTLYFTLQTSRERGDHLRHPSVTFRDSRREVKYCISKVSSADTRMAKGTLSITTHNKSSSTKCTWLLKTLLSEGLQCHLWMEVCLCCSIYSTQKYLKNNLFDWSPLHFVQAFIVPRWWM